MEKMIGTIALVFLPLLGNTQEPKALKLQCSGTYKSYAAEDREDVDLSGVYVEVKGSRIKFVGAPGFDATYEVTANKDNGIGFELKSNPLYSGFLNRYSGKLSLTEMTEKQNDGSFKVKQMISATCEKAKPIF